MTPIDFIVWAMTAAVCLVVIGLGVSVAIAMIRGALAGPKPKDGEK